MDLLGFAPYLVFAVPIVIFAAIATLAILVAQYGAKKAQERLAAFGALAARYGFIHERPRPGCMGGSGPSTPRVVAERIAGTLEPFWPFDQGHSRTVGNLLHGSDSRGNWALFEYQYTETSGSGEDRKSTTYPFSVVVLSPPAVLPELDIRREGLGDRIAGFFGARDVQFESEEFNRAYHVTSSVPKFASDVVHPEMMEFLLAFEDFSVQVAGRHIVLTETGTRDPAWYEGAMRTLGAFWDRVPQFVKHDLRVEQAGF